MLISCSCWSRLLSLSGCVGALQPRHFFLLPPQQQQQPRLPASKHGKEVEGGRHWWPRVPCFVGVSSPPLAAAWLEAGWIQTWAGHCFFLPAAYPGSPASADGRAASGLLAVAPSGLMRWLPSVLSSCCGLPSFSRGAPAGLAGRITLDIWSAKVLWWKQGHGHERSRFAKRAPDTRQRIIMLFQEPLADGGDASDTARLVVGFGIRQPLHAPDRELIHVF